MLGILVGIVSGIICGMGMGGGTLLIPLLIFVLNFTQLGAQSVNLVAFIPTAIISLIISTKNKLVDYKKTYLIAVFGCIGSACGAMLASTISGKYLQRGFGVFLCVLGLWQLVSVFAFKRKGKLKNEKFYFSTYKVYLVNYNILKDNLIQK